MGAIGKRAFLLTVLLFAPAVVFAQGSIAGTVTDPSGAVLPGVTVEASSDVLIDKTRSATTDTAGLYRIVDLPRGTYTLTFTLSGFTTTKRDGIEVAGSATFTVSIELKVGGLQETVTITGVSPIVDVQNTRRETVIGSGVLEGLPTTRAYGAVLNAMPGVTVDNNGLAATPTMTFFSAHGGRTNEGRMMINGMTVAAAFNGGGVSSLTYDTNNVEEVSVLVSGGLGESETGGPVMNLLPKSGGNRFSGQAFLNYAGGWSSGNNLDDYLRSINFASPPAIINSYDGSGSFGGPIRQDRIWFYGSYRKFTTAQQVDQAIGANAFAGDPSHWDYRRDGSITARNVQGRDIYSGRFTAQVTPRNRVTFSQEYQRRCEGSTLTPSGSGCRVRANDWIALGSPTQSPEANTGYFDFPYYVTQATWTSTLTSKILLEAGYSRFAYHHAGGPGQLAPDGNFSLIPVTETRAIQGHPANFTYRGLASYQDDYGNPNSWRASMSYVTGSHNMKIGYQGAYLIADVTTIADNSQLAYTFQNGAPLSFTYRLQNFQTADRTRSTALFIQDTWTLKRWTFQGALRYDRASSFSPAEHNGTTTTTRFNANPITFARTDGVNAYNDISPRFGVAYDVFGNGKTAIKFNMGRYLAPATNDTIYTQNNPANRIVSNLTPGRQWTEVDGDFVIPCDLNITAAQNFAGGDSCGALGGNQLNFGQSVVSTTVNPALLHGWGVRPVDWQYGINLNQELLPKVSLEVGYNRRWWGNFTLTANRNLSPSDYQPWTITAPADSRLPGGGGYPVTVYTLTQGAFNRAADNYVTFETDYGPARDNYWQGVDVTLNARIGSALVVQGGTTTGRTYEDTCASIVHVNNPDPRNCHNVEPYLTALRGLVSYTVPKIDALLSATVRSQPPLQLLGAPPPPNTNAGITLTGTNPSGANWQVPNTVVQGILLRPVPGGTPGGNTTVALLDNGDHRLYADNRRTQIDLRLAKVLRFSNRKATVGFDLYNLLNTNYAITYQTEYVYGANNGGTWENPATILTPRFVRFNVTLDF